ncbi:hypothetical protein BCR41DRAFT_21824 [Lobosporangium transversale]|uniref:Uncharacterized protein n=1 Tax=Lobosporangium transversale TaxID=64571 RepID=A0A1Y2GST3_9FUNG|nr:hypothetical protein BCR41DRAFT_21824 [Lobosporangium transversale]ORZ21840.1 hypothetical protein BCR41DRAFT_21824 [Lobosporangium transversale]|eukprot:XP_021883091.1 hypothetical protein BCR41DRAFT_21824 [Lobosporangium transversale]
MVQNRMNRIKREMAQSKRMAAKSAPRRLTFVNPVEVTGYSSCDDDCSSYDSYSSSGSECSDCEICRPPRHLRIPQLKPPKGLNRREMALDLAFLFPQPQFNKDYFRATTELAGSQDLIGYSRQYNSEGEEPLRPTAKNQQYMIDHLNDERRRKRRVLDRELQNKVAYKKHPDDEKGYRIEGLSSNDMDVDQAQDIMYLEREASAGPSTFESGSRPHSPITAKSTLRSSLNRDSKSHQPRFLPGFGPDGMQSPRRTAESLPIPPPLPRYSTADRHGQSLDSNHLRAQEPYRTYGRDILPYPMTERDIPRVHGQWSGQEASWNPQSQTYIQQHLRQQEVHDAAYRSHQDLHLSDNDFSYKAPPPEDVYPFESERRIKFKHVFPQQRRLPPSPPLLPPPPQDPNRYQHPRVRPLKSKPLPLVDLADSQGQTYDRSLPPRGRPRMATSVRLTHQDGLNHNTGLRTGEGIESTHVNLYNSPAGTSRFKMQGQPYERFVTKPLTSTPPSSSMPPPSRATPWHHPYTGPPSSGQRHPHRHQPRSTSRQRLQQPAPRYSREPSTTPTFMDLTSPASSPKQSSATLPSPRMSVPTSDGNALMANGEQQNGLSLGADRIESQSTSTSPSHYIKEDPSDTLSKHDKTTVEID